MEISDEVMWRATVDCDKEFDGRFFYAVKTVGVYCRPSCKSKPPLRKNVRFFENRTDAEKNGFRPCKRCRPDLPEYAPIAQTAAQIKDIYDRWFQDSDTLKAEMKTFGMTLSHCAVTFKKQYGISPTEYVGALRQRCAAELLKGTDMQIIDIAGESGFGSLSAFNAFFKKRTGQTPTEYRKGLAHGKA